MEVSRVNTSQSNQSGQSGTANLIQGPSWLVEERDACGVGFIADKEGRASHKILSNALKALTCMEHRGGCSADQDSGDGQGFWTAMPCSSWKNLCLNTILHIPAMGFFSLPQMMIPPLLFTELQRHFLPEQDLN